MEASMPRVLIADKLSPAAVRIFEERGVKVDVKTGLKKDELLAIIDQYDGLAVRSATKADKEVIAAAKKLAAALEKEGVALDVGGYRDAPPGLRLWCGATVETADVEAVCPWMDWAFASVAAELSPA